MPSYRLIAYFDLRHLNYGIGKATLVWRTTLGKVACAVNLFTDLFTGDILILLVRRKYLVTVWE